MNGRSVQHVQPYYAQQRIDVQPDIGFVDVQRPGLDIQQIRVHPNIQPLPKSLFVRFNVGTAINGRGGGFQLFSDFLLRLSVMERWICLSFLVVVIFRIELVPLAPLLVVLVRGI